MEPATFSVAKTTGPFAEPATFSVAKDDMKTHSQHIIRTRARR
ncbi:hypothetical protein OOU_Y34scaffold01093g5 [Pyricularia oryzae Y34]|uniref:Uncharacterized protein n=1 Tax=Pyricularia oryzae (strain Y34) TaxID=1143189 RepID=A0AA97NLX4_PYRO3|nr:hypothetical protein OOU_Y34scaffold01093g5 [Pyricularia oryzae Y34]